MRPLPGNEPLVDAIQRHGEQVFGAPIPAMGTPLYTDVRLELEDLRRATKVVARALRDLLR